MNLYLVVSEWLQTQGHYDPPEPPEDYRIADLVVAGSPGQATYMAWKNDRDSWTRRSTIGDKPRFQVRLKAKGVPGPARIASDEYTDTDGMYWVLDAEPDLELEDE